MDSSSYTRAAMSAGVWFATAYGLGTALGIPISINDYAIDSAIMGSSALASDFTHGVLGWAPTGMTSMVGSGVYYAAIQKAYRGDNSYGQNFAMAAANDWLVDTVAYAMAPPA